MLHKRTLCYDSIEIIGKSALCSATSWLGARPARLAGDWRRLLLAGGSRRKSQSGADAGFWRKQKKRLASISNAASLAGCSVLGGNQNRNSSLRKTSERAFDSLKPAPTEINSRSIAATGAATSRAFGDFTALRSCHLSCKKAQPAARRQGSKSPLPCPRHPTACRIFPNGF